MKHQSTRAVFEYWNKKRGTQPAPARSEIDPTEIRHALSDTFMLAADFTDQLRFRLAGTRVCALFGREIKGEAFAELWSESSRKSIDELLAIVTHEAIGAVAGLTAQTEDGAKADLELLLLPLAHAGHARIARHRRAGADRSALLAWRQAGHRTHARHPASYRSGRGHQSLRRVSCRRRAGSRVRHGFVVYSGGRSGPVRRPDRLTPR